MRYAMGMLAASAMLFLACGGESESGNTDAGSGTGGTSNGGTSSGGTSSGGTSSGGTGGTATGGTAGTTSSVCALPEDPGPCDGAMRRWWFDSATGKCTPFIYGGCEGNGNNFQTAMECVGACAPGAENACTAIACPQGGICVYTSPTNATCATSCSAGVACPPGSTCGCGASCSGCKDCVQVCVEVEG